MSFDEFLKQNALYIALFFVALIGINIILFFAIPHAKKKGKDKENAKEINNFAAFFNFCGGKDNIEKLSLQGSRLSLFVKNKNTVNIEELKKNGVEKVISMSEKYVLLINEDLKGVVEEFYK